jgi:hypothetical protein
MALSWPQWYLQFIAANPGVSQADAYKWYQSGAQPVFQGKVSGDMVQAAGAPPVSQQTAVLPKIGANGGVVGDDYAGNNFYGRNANVASLQQGQSSSIPEGETPPVIDASGRIVVNPTPYGEKNNSFTGALREGTGGAILALAGGAAFGGAGAAGAGTDAASLSAADAAGGLMPEYGTTAAYNAGIGGATAPTLQGYYGAQSPTLLADSGQSVTDVGPPLTGPGSAGQPYDMGQVTVSAPANSAPVQAMGNTPISSVTGITPGSTLYSGASIPTPDLSSVPGGLQDIPQLSSADLGAVQTAAGSSTAAGGSSALVGGAVPAAAAGAGTAAVNGVGSDPAPAPAPSSPQDIQMGQGTSTGGYNVDPNTGDVTGGGNAANGAAGAGGTALSRILGGNASAADWASVLGTGGATALGMYGANQQANAMQGMYNQFLGLGAPSRDRYEASFDPNFDISKMPGVQSALDTTNQSMLRQASIGGNPAGNPSVLAEINKYALGSVALPALQQYRNQNAATGGYGAFNSAAPSAGAGAISAGGNVYNAAGYGLGQITNPMPTLDQYFKKSAA